MLVYYIDSVGIVQHYLRNRLPPSPTYNILIIDDEPILLDLLADMLEPHRCSKASSFEDACAYMTTEIFDVVVCDLMMPKISGLDLYHQAVHKFPNLQNRFVFITGGMGDIQLEQQLEETKQMVLFKPFTIAHLQNTVDQVVQKFA